MRIEKKKPRILKIYLKLNNNIHVCAQIQNP